MRERIKITPELFETLRALNSAYLSEDGREMVNPEPLMLSTDLDRPPTLQEQIQRCLRVELSKQADLQGQETFAESMDFDVTNEFDSDPANTEYETMADEFVLNEEEQTNLNEIQDPEATVDSSTVDPEPGPASDPVIEPEDSPVVT